MNALFLKDLADKTYRGTRGHVEADKSEGGNSHGNRASLGLCPRRSTLPRHGTACSRLFLQPDRAGEHPAESVAGPQAVTFGLLDHHALPFMAMGTVRQSH
jgi:hypothetical protein